MSDSTENPLAAAATAARFKAVTSALLEALTTTEVARIILEQGLNYALGAYAGSIALLSPQKTDVEIFQSIGYTPEQIAPWKRIPLQLDAPITDAVRTGKPVYLTSRQHWEVRYPHSEATRLLAPHSRAWCAVPLQVHGQTIGALGLSFDAPRVFTDQERDEITTLSQQCALALERARLYTASEEARTRAEAAEKHQAFLAEASAMLVQSLDYHRMLGQIARLAVPDLADWATVDLFPEDGDRERETVTHVSPNKAEWFHEARHPDPNAPDSANSPIRQTIPSRETLFLPHVPEEGEAPSTDDDAHRQRIREQDFNSYLCVPLRIRDVVLGAITLATTRASGRQLTPETVSLIEELARRAAAAVDNARLFANIERKEARYRNLFASHPQPMWVYDVDTLQILDVNNQAVDLYGFSRNEFLVMSIKDLRPAEDDASFMALMETVRQSHSSLTQVVRHRAKSGTIIDVDVTGSPVDYHNRNARIVRVTDVTERLRADEARRAYEEQIAFLLAQQTELLHQQTLHIAKQRAFLKDVLLATTDGVLRLCDTEADLPPPLLVLNDQSAQDHDPLSLSAPTLRIFRRQVEAAARACDFQDVQVYDLLTAAGEAAMNVAVHSSGKTGTGRVLCDPVQGIVQTWIQDSGPGIPVDRLHRAVLERGWTTAGSLGHGFFMMLGTAERIFLLTQEGQGTTIVIEKSRTPMEPEWMQRRKNELLS